MICLDTAKRYCKDYAKIENYEEAVNSSEKWECHHLLEIAPFSGKPVSMKFLKEQGLYFDQAPESLIFLKETDHKRLHSTHRSSETLRKMSALGKKRIEETKERISKANKGKHWYTNGEVNVFCYECPEGFTKGCTQHTTLESKASRKEKLRQFNKGKHWYTNGIVNVHIEKCPEGFWRGMTLKSKPTGRPKKR